MKWGNTIKTKEIDGPLFSLEPSDPAWSTVCLSLL